MNIIKAIKDIFCYQPQPFYASILNSVCVDDVDACMRWAFGDGYGMMLFSDSKDVWNERHGDIFTIYNHDLLDEVLKRIGMAYLESVK